MKTLTLWHFALVLDSMHPFDFKQNSEPCSALWSHGVFHVLPEEAQRQKQ